MSIQAVGWVFEHSRSRGVARLVLLSLANHHNAGTGQCNPGQRRIAHEAGISPSTVSEAIGRLVKLGEVAVVSAGTGTRSSDYHLPWLSTVLHKDLPNPPVALGRRALADEQRAASARDSGPSARITASSARPEPIETRTMNQEPRPDPKVVRGALAASRIAIGRPKEDAVSGGGLPAP